MRRSRCEIRVVDHGRGDWDRVGRDCRKRSRTDKNQEGEDGEVKREGEGANRRQHLGGVDGEEQFQLMKGRMGQQRLALYYKAVE